ncbi:glycoside hydrolase family 13 protein [Paremcibacter congregatus]|uniref:Alpha-amlyase n=1 Tax=Paremcibacter congregatus TaxID=2043170 RepID=A0A2G4YRY5_9PROT|nr:glycoside hydrolase family 13 protein [Paremcibacter congregatus]PHZ85124.1 alpha-amlyase [Paremcibacter congregatus]QDE27940.1 alpha-amlyase [Paremcibacter congregatus]
MKTRQFFQTIAVALILTLGIFTSALQAAEAIKRVEPPFWWVGFEDTHLQVMVYGPDIAAMTPSITAAGVTLDKVIQVKNANYLFLNLTLAPEAKAGKFDILFQGEGGKGIVYSYELRARKAGSADRQGFTSADAIYLVTPDRFANGDPSNDSQPHMADKLNRADKDGRHGGDIQGMIDHLDYMADMGFTMLWPMPLQENDQQRTSYHGYSITDFYNQDARYGTNEDFLALTQQARARGMGVIMDMVANHIGSGHWWMQDMPMDDWLNFYQQDYVQSSHVHNTVYDPYAAQEDKEKFSGGWFDTTMPDLNQKNPLLATYLIQNAIWWVEYADLAGIRMDTYSYPDMDFMAEWAGRIMQEYPRFTIVGEEFEDNRAMVSYWQRGKVNRNGYRSALPSLIDFPLHAALVKGLTEKDGWREGLKRLYGVLSMDLDYAAPEDLVILSDNHDMSRLYTQLGEDFDLYKMAMAYTLTMRGIPQIFYGTEILKTSPEVKDDGKIRSDFPGGWAGDKVNAFTGEGLGKTEKAAQDFVRRLANWRKTKKSLHVGKLMHYVPQDGIYVYFRYTDQEKVMVVLNKNGQAKDLPVARFAEMLAGTRRGHDVITGQDLDITQKIPLGARSVTILEIE